MEPFIEELKRRIALRREEDALALCEDVILGLYRVRTSESAELLPLGAEFPAETAREVFEVWSRGSRRLAAMFLNRVSEWKKIFRHRVTPG